MRVKKKLFNGTEYETNLTDVVEGAFESYRDGTVEETADVLDKLVRSYARLLNVLADKGILNKEEILGIVDSYVQLEFVGVTKYYKLIGASTKLVIGCCTSETLEHCLKQDPGTTFLEISQREFDNFDELDF